MSEDKDVEVRRSSSPVLREGEVFIPCSTVGAHSDVEGTPTVSPRIYIVPFDVGESGKGKGQNVV